MNELVSDMSTSKASERVTCAHCGLPVPGNMLQSGQQLQFCCSGCKQVYAILHEEGFEEYYNYQALTDDTPQAASISGRAFTDFDDETFQLNHVKDTETGTKTAQLYLEGVHCAACVWLVERYPLGQEGVLNIRLDLPRAVAEIEWDSEKVNLSNIARSLDRIGYSPHAYRASDVRQLRKKEDRALLIKLGVAIVCALNVMMVEGALYAGEYSGMESNFFSFFRWVAFGLTLPVVLFSARPFFTAALAGLKQHVPHMDLPISIGILAGFGFSAVSTLRGEGSVYFDSVCALVALLLAGRFLQQRAQRAALDLAERLNGSSFTEFARKIDTDGVSTEKPLETIVRGDRLEVLPGDIVPADGLVSVGRSRLNNAVITGESEPQSVRAGSDIHAGAINLDSRLEIVATAVGERTRLGALIKLVEQASSKRASIVRTADSISHYFVLTVLALATATGLYWAFIEPHRVLEQVIALLVVTCPCALGLATPTAVTVALAKAGRRGIFLKRPDLLEMLSKVDTAVFDKTGTLTRGESSLVRWQGSENTARLALALEMQTTHPLARSFARSFEHVTASHLQVTNVQESLGRGVSGTVDGHRVQIGNRRFMKQHEVAINTEWEQAEENLLKDLLSPLFVAVDGQLEAIAGFGDPIRPEAGAALDHLRDQGWKLHVSSGDNGRIVEQIAQQLNLPPEHVKGDQSPEEKLALIQHLLDTHENSNAGKVLMVGDGANDAAALAAADIGVSVHGGSGASIQAADVVLTRAGLNPIVELVEGGKRTLGIIHRCLIFSLIYNLACASLAFFGLVGPLLAAILMPISSLSVVGFAILGRSFASYDARKSTLLSQTTA